MPRQTPIEALPRDLQPVAKALVEELKSNPLLADFSGSELTHLVCSSSYRSILEREHLARQSGFR